jgi:hypothetical protein
MNRVLPLVRFDMACQRLNELSPVRVVTTAALALASTLTTSGVAKVDFMRKPLTNAVDVGATLGKAPLAFALTVFDHDLRRLIEEVKKIHELYPQSFVLLGGTSVNTAKNMKDLAGFFPGTVILYKGDGEKGMASLVKILENESPLRPFSTDTQQALKQMGGIYVRHFDFEYRDEEPNQLTAKEASDARNDYGIPELAEEIKKFRCLPLITSRGCNNHCSFCSMQYHSKIVGWSAERIIEELRLIRALIEQGKLPEEAKTISFDDDNFLLNRKRGKAFLAQFAADDSLRNYFHLSFQASVDTFYRGKAMDIELLDLIVAANPAVSIGTDGFHPQALREFNKKYTWAQAKALFHALAKRNVRQTHYGILTYMEISPIVLIRSIRNMRDVIFVDKNTRLLVSAQLTAFQNAPVGRQLLQAGGEMDQLVSEDGRVWKLPAGVPIRDRELATLMGALLRFEVTEENFAEMVGEKLWESISPVMREKLVLSFRQDILQGVRTSFPVHRILDDSGGNMAIMMLTLNYLLRKLLEKYPQFRIREDGSL